MAGETARSTPARTLLPGDVHPAAAAAVAGPHAAEGRLQPALSYLPPNACNNWPRTPRFVGGQIGMVGILQTWTRDLRYHPHVHFLVPGGGLSTDGRRGYAPRITSSSTSNRCPGSSGQDARWPAQGGIARTSPDETWRQDWVVDCRPVGKGESALKYLAPYVFRVALSNKRILKVQDGQVTFRYQDGETKRQRPVHAVSRGLHPALPAACAAQRLCQGALLRVAGARQSQATGPSQTAAWQENR